MTYPPEFYSAVAQLIPLLLLTLIVGESRLLSRQALSGDWNLPVVVVALAFVAEAVCLVALASPGSVFAAEAGIAVIIAAIGLAFALCLVLALSETLAQGYDPRIGGLGLIALTVALMGGIVSGLMMAR